MNISTNKKKKKQIRLNEAYQHVQMFDIILAVLFTLFCITTIYPFINVLSLSLTPADVSVTRFRLFTPRIDFSNYRAVLSSETLYLGLLNTLLRVFLGTSIQLIAIIGCAYALSKKHFPNRKFWTGAIIFTMYFSGGLIPTYLLIKSLKLLDNIFVYIFPALIPSFTMLIMRNFFMTLPVSLEESASLEGANDIIILFKIIVPVSMPIIATVTLWQVVGHWNAWFDCMIYMQDSKKAVLMLILRRLLLEGSDEIAEVSATAATPIRRESVKAAATMLTILPIICVYPFLQKYFVKGIMIGSLKG